MNSCVIRKHYKNPILTSAMLLGLLSIPASADGICPVPGDKLIITHPSSYVPETRLRCGSALTPNVIEVPASAPPVAKPARPVVRVVVVKRVIVKRIVVHASPRRRAPAHHGPLDFLFHPGR